MRRRIVVVGVVLGGALLVVAPQLGADIPLVKEILKNLAGDIYTLVKFGIGTTSPSEPLEVVGNAKVSANLMVDTPTLVVDAATNRVGIGTATPAHTLDVAGTVQMTGFQMPTGMVANYVLTTDATGVGTWQPPSNTSGWFDAGAAVRLITLGDAVSIGTAAPLAKLEVRELGLADPFRVGVGAGPGLPVAQLIVTNAGNVGIGVAVPLNRLDVSGAAVIGAGNAGGNVAPANGLLVQGKVGIGLIAPVQTLDVAGNAAIGAGFAGANSAPPNGLVVQGAVGIGVALPLNKLDVSGNAAIGAAFTAPGAALAPADGLLVQGNVGIGTDAPFGRLHVLGRPDQLDHVNIEPGEDTAAAGTPRLSVEIGEPSLLGTTDILSVRGARDAADRVVFMPGFDTPAPGTPDLAVGIGTLTPQGRLEVRGADDVSDKVLFTPGADTAAPGAPDIRVGIGTLTPEGRLHVRGKDDEISVVVLEEGADTAAPGSPDLQVGIGTTPLLGRLEVQGADDVHDSVLFFPGADTAAPGTPDISVGVGTIFPTERLDVNGTAKMTGFKMPTGAQNKYVLTSDAAGVGTWERPLEAFHDEASGSIMILGSWVADPAIAITVPASANPRYALVVVSAEFFGNGHQVSMRLELDGQPPFVGSATRIATIPSVLSSPMSYATVSTNSRIVIPGDNLPHTIGIAARSGPGVTGLSYIANRSMEVILVPF